MTDLKPGRELDALIAHSVMGWRVIPYVSTSEKGPAIVSSSLDEHDMYRKWPGDTFWSPSRDIAVAWEVVEKLKSNGLGIRIHYSYDQWHVDFEHEDSWDFDKGQDTAPYAISLAALKAVGYTPSTTMLY